MNRLATKSRWCARPQRRFGRAGFWAHVRASCVRPFSIFEIVDCVRQVPSTNSDRVTSLFSQWFELVFTSRARGGVDQGVYQIGEVYARS